MNTMDKILLILLITILAFVITVMVYNAFNKQVQDSLINTFMGAIGVELASMGGIKMFKVKHLNKKENEDE